MNDNVIVDKKALENVLLSTICAIGTIHLRVTEFSTYLRPNILIFKNIFIVSYGHRFYHERGGLECIP